MADLPGFLHAAHRNARVDVMLPPLQHADHAGSIRAVFRFSEDLSLRRDHFIFVQNQMQQFPPAR